MRLHRKLLEIYLVRWTVTYEEVPWKQCLTPTSYSLQQFPHLPNLFFNTFHTLAFIKVYGSPLYHWKSIEDNLGTQYLIF